MVTTLGKRRRLSEDRPDPFSGERIECASGNRRYIVASQIYRGNGSNIESAVRSNDKTAGRGDAVLRLGVDHFPREYANDVALRIQRVDDVVERVGRYAS